MIPFNIPYVSGKEVEYISQAISSHKLSGDGPFTKKCQNFFEDRYGFKKCLLTTSCTDALEMASILADIQPGDEVIMPSYTFVSTPNAFVLRGARIIFADSDLLTPNLDLNQVEKLIMPRTKAIVIVHYAGFSCDMEQLVDLVNKHNIYLIEDAAQAIDSFYKGRALGSFGQLAAFSFHETKNIQCGEGGLLVINDEKLVKRAEIIREKGTNRSAFFRGEIDKYGWVDVGSSFLPSDILAAFLYAQLEQIDNIQDRRKHIWNKYYEHLKTLEKKEMLRLPSIPENTTNNAHMFYILCRNGNERAGLINHLKSKNISAVFHYLSLHKSKFYEQKHDQRELPQSDYYSDCLVRLPLFYDLSDTETETISKEIINYYSLLG